MTHLIHSKLFFSNSFSFLHFLGSLFSEANMTFQKTSKLEEAVLSGAATTVEQLINDKTDINLKNSMGETLLHLATCRNFVSVARVLLRHGANPNARTNDMDTPLHSSSVQGYTNVVQLLLENGAD